MRTISIARIATMVVILGLVTVVPAQTSDTAVYLQGQALKVSFNAKIVCFLTNVASNARLAGIEVVGIDGNGLNEPVVDACVLPGETIYLSHENTGGPPVMRCSFEVGTPFGWVASEQVRALDGNSAPGTALSVRHLTDAEILGQRENTDRRPDECPTTR